MIVGGSLERNLMVNCSNYFCYLVSNETFSAMKGTYNL